MTKIMIKSPGPVINEGYVVVKGSLCGGIDGANLTHLNNETMQSRVREGIQKNRFFLGKSPKLWVGGGQES